MMKKHYEEFVKRTSEVREYHPYKRLIAEHPLHKEHLLREERR